jgi:hypothetical protein
MAMVRAGLQGNASKEIKIPLFMTNLSASP